MRLRTSSCEIPRFNRVIKKFLAASTFFSKSPHRFKHMCADVIFKKLALFESFKAVFKPGKSFASGIETLKRSRLRWKGTTNFLRSHRIPFFKCDMGDARHVFVNPLIAIMTEIKNLINPQGRRNLEDNLGTGQSLHSGMVIRLALTVPTALQNWTGVMRRTCELTQSDRRASTRMACRSDAAFVRSQAGMKYSPGMQFRAGKFQAI